MKNKGVWCQQATEALLCTSGRRVVGSRARCSGSVCSPAEPAAAHVAAGHGDRATALGTRAASTEQDHRRSVLGTEPCA